MDIWRGSGQRWRSEKPGRQEKASPFGHNLFLLQVLIFALFGILALQLVRMQVFEASHYQQKAENNRLRELQVLPLRGLIYDRNGTPLVQNVPNYTAVVTPADLPTKNEDEVFAQLGEVLKMSPQEIAQKVGDKQQDGNPYEAVVIRDELDRDTALILKELTPKLPGVELRVEARRSYPSGDLTSQIVGYVGSISEEEYASLRPRVHPERPGGQDGRRGNLRGCPARQAGPGPGGGGCQRSPARRAGHTGGPVGRERVPDNRPGPPARGDRRPASVHGHV